VFLLFVFLTHIAHRARVFLKSLLCVVGCGFWVQNPETAEIEMEHWMEQVEWECTVQYDRARSMNA
jgi:Tfp pilus assembly protein PilP